MPVLFEYVVSNTGNARLSSVTVMDDNGTTGNSSDDVVVCSNQTVEAGATTSCTRSMTLSQEITLTAHVTGQDDLNKPVTAYSDPVTVEIGMMVHLPIGISGQ